MNECKVQYPVAAPLSSIVLGSTLRRCLMYLLHLLTSTVCQNKFIIGSGFHFTSHEVLQFVAQILYGIGIWRLRRSYPPVYLMINEERLCRTRRVLFEDQELARSCFRTVISCKPLLAAEKYNSMKGYSVIMILKCHIAAL